MDRRLPSEGAAAPGVLILNPRMLNEQPAIVRLFVFHHECGHHHVGESELKADCWAVDRGVRDGWLDQRGLKEVCDSFEDAPETSSHPSGRRRCRNIDQCFATALAALPPRTPIGPKTAAPPTRLASASTPKLVKEPTLVATGWLRYADNRPCPETHRARANDAIGKLLEKSPRPPVATDRAREGECALPCAEFATNSSFLRGACRPLALDSPPARVTFLHYQQD